MTALPAADGSWDGLVSFYALIHMIKDADVRTALAEFRRILAGGGLLLLAVHAGEEVRHSAEWFGATVDVSFRFFDPGWLGAELDRSGFAVQALTVRQPYPDVEVATERAYFLARAVLRFSGATVPSGWVAGAAPSCSSSAHSSASSPSEILSG
jgi:Methyltransferase domain